VNNKFVFVIPYYNTKDDIAKTLYSTMAQSYNEWRAIVINDMSVDDGPSLVKHIVDGS